MSETKKVPITLKNFEQICKELFETKVRLDEKEAEAKAIAEELDMKKKQVFAFMEENEKEKHHVAGHGLIFMEDRFTVPTPKSLDQKKEFFAYLQKRGIFFEMASVNSQTLNSFYKTELESELAKGNADFKLPGIGEPSMQRSLKMRKG